MSVAKRLGAAAVAILCVLFAAVAFSQSASAYPTGTQPLIALGHDSGPVGDTVYVSGENFTPGKTATLSFHSAVVELKTVDVNSQGKFATTITIPTDPLGLHHVEGLDVASGDVSNDAAYTITGSGTGGTGGTGGGGGGLANTGVAVLGIAALGLVLLVGGGLMLMAGRRRKVVA